MERLSRQAALSAQQDVIDLTESPPSTAQGKQRSKPWGALPQSESNAPPPIMRPIEPRVPGSLKPEGPPNTQPRRHIYGKKENEPVRYTEVGSGGAFNLRPATVGAFGTQTARGPHDRDTRVSSFASKPSVTPNGWPAWLVGSQIGGHTTKRTESATREEAEEGERFDIDAIRLSASDLDRCEGDAEAHMRELLSGAIGAGEDAVGDDAEGGDLVEGFAKGIRLMPHQVRGVRWMRSREANRKTGGILADDMGLGKTIQTLACVVQGRPTAADRRAGYRGGTLIVAPLAVIEQWAAEIRQKTSPGTVKILIHHGPGRSKSSKTLEQYDVVITTYQTLASEHGAHAAKTAERQDSDSSDAESPVPQRKAQSKKPAPQALYGVRWHRIVVDEAHNIRNRSTKASKAAVALAAKFRWCLTGTPIQNNVEELYALFSFLRAKPLDDWTVFRERILTPVRQGQTKLAMKRLHILLKAIMLRRTKDATIDGQPILKLPARIIEVVDCPFDSEERAFYIALEKQTSLTFNKFLRQGTAMANITSVLTMLLRLRQACDHPSLVISKVTTDIDAIASTDVSPAGRDEADAEADDLASLLGGLKVAGTSTCSICHTSLKPNERDHCADCAKLAWTAHSRSTDSAQDLPPISAKIRVILRLLSDIDERGDRKQKTILFSQFTSFLNLIEPFLRERGIKFVRYDGSMRNDKRQEALDKIRSSKDTRLILISFKAGSTGLNLTCCNNVILTDLWWNPALEDQAFDRAHRLGQTLDVNIFKLTVKETVEDRILALQEQKRELASAALSGKAARNITKLTLNDLMALFRSTASGDERDSDSD